MSEENFIKISLPAVNTRMYRYHGLVENVNTPSGKPELIKISFSCTLASQVILKVDICKRLCSQNLASASSPLNLKTR